jgi:threonine dehydratase
MKLTPEHIAKAATRIAPYINKTPILSSSILNEHLGNTILFKCEGFQKTGSFKFRGAINTLLSMQEQNELPEKVCAFSSGNHAQAIACAAKIMGIKAHIFIPEGSSEIKIAATRGYGADITICKTRAEAEQIYKTSEDYFIHPFNDPRIIAGQGTACYEALQENIKPDAIFATCGGGGWVSGSYLAKELLHPTVKIYAGEPLNANDASISYRTGKIHSLSEQPNTIADGARSLSVGDVTFEILKKLDGFYETPEDEIIYWTQQLSHYLKITVEPTSAVAMAACAKWAQENGPDHKLLVLLSGANVAPETHLKVWQSELL